MRRWMPPISVSARPDFSVPMYPVITMGEGAHQGSRDKLLGLNAAPDRVDAYSIQNHVPADTPPTFMALAADDATVIPLPNAGAYYVALQTGRVPSEIHIFEAGGHGFGLARTVGRPTAVWPDLLLRWGASKVTSKVKQLRAASRNPAPRAAPRCRRRGAAPAR